MAKTMWEINLNYNRSIQHAEELEGVARELKSLADQEYAGHLSQVKASWTGESATAYIGKAQTLQGKIEKNASDLERVAKTIRSIAKRTRAADINARNIALSSGES